MTEQPHDPSAALPSPGHLGGIVAHHVPLLRGSTRVAYLTALLAFPTGFWFTLGVEQRFGASGNEGHPSVAFTFADHTRITTDSGPKRLLLWEAGHSSGNSSASWRWTYWTPTLPPAGRIAVVGHFDGATLNGAFDAAPIRAAAGHAFHLWHE